MVYAKTQRMCAWSGLICAALFFAGLMISGFFPVPSPSLTQDQVVTLYQGNTTGIRVGMILVLISAMFIPPFVAAISVQLKRIEGGTPILTYTQLSAGTVSALFFIVPAVLFLITAYRPERPPELTYLLNDFSWIMALVPWPPFFIQNLAIAIAIFGDKNSKPIFPRWMGYVQLCCCAMMTPASLLPFFKSGPFAWNGLVSFWIPVTQFVAWHATMSFILMKAIKRQELEATV